MEYTVANFIQSPLSQKDSVRQKEKSDKINSLRNSIYKLFTRMQFKLKVGLQMDIYKLKKAI